MCFHISIKSGKEKIENKFNIQFDIGTIFKSQNHISAFTNPLIPCITTENNIKKIALCNWGLIPHWIESLDKAREIRKLTYNAKSETVQKKASFKNSIKDNKCLVIADGFYEWKLTTKGKDCYYISIPNNELFTFAGIQSNWLDKSSGEMLSTVSILTQSANKMMEQIHNVKKRQPVILKENNMYKWLKSGLDYEEILNDAYNINLESKLVDSPLRIKKGNYNLPIFNNRLNINKD